MDLAAAYLEVYRRPRPGGYGDVPTVSRGRSLAPEAFPGLG